MYFIVTQKANNASQGAYRGTIIYAVQAKRKSSKDDWHFCTLWNNDDSKVPLIFILECDAQKEKETWKDFRYDYRVVKVNVEVSSVEDKP